MYYFKKFHKKISDGVLFVSQTYHEEGRPCLSKYWKIYFPYREISLALFFRLFVSWKKLRSTQHSCFRGKSANDVRNYAQLVRIRNEVRLNHLKMTISIRPK